jgi:hypothetical protein
MNTHVLRESAIDIGVYFCQTSRDIDGDTGSLILWNFSKGCHTGSVLQQSRRKIGCKRVGGLKGSLRGGAAATP